MRLSKNHHRLDQAILQSKRLLCDVAAGFGVSTTTLYAWRKGKWRPSVRAANEINAVFPSVPVSEW